MLSNLIDNVKSLFTKSSDKSSDSVTISIPTKELSDTKIEISVTKPHVLDDMLSHDNIKASNDLLTAVTVIKQKHLEFQKYIDSLESATLQERLLRTTEVDKLVSQAQDALREFIKFPHAVAVSQILPEYKKNRMQLITEQCYAIASGIQRMQNSSQSVDTLSFLNSIKQSDTDEKDFMEIEPNGINIYLAKLRSKPEKSLLESGLLLNILKVGVNVRKETPALLSTVLSNDETEMVGKAIVSNNEFETAIKTEKNEMAVFAASKLNQDLPKLKSMLIKLENKKENTANWLKRIDEDKEMMKIFETELNNINKKHLFDEHWNTFFTNLDLLSQIRLQIEQNQILIEDNIIMVKNIVKNEDNVKKMLGLIT